MERAERGESPLVEAARNCDELRPSVGIGRAACSRRRSVTFSALVSSRRCCCASCPKVPRSRRDMRFVSTCCATTSRSPVPAHRESAMLTLQIYIQDTNI